MRPVRISTKAIIIREGSLLAVESIDEKGPWYLLPGGGQEAGETLHEALQRECHEEIGTSVEIGPLLFVRDYIARNHEFAYRSEDFHQVELMFSCCIPDDYSLNNGHQPDPMQTGVRWIALADLPQTRLYPKVLIELLQNLDMHAQHPVYLGDVN